MREKLAAAAAEASRLQRLRTEHNAHQQAAMLQVPGRLRCYRCAVDHSTGVALDSDAESYTAFGFVMAAPQAEHSRRSTYPRHSFHTGMPFSVSRP